MTRTKPTDVDEYIASFPAHVQTLLKQLRAIVRKAAPGAEETISYQIPAFKWNGPLIFFAAYNAHIGLYPMTSAIRTKLKKELLAYEGGPGKATLSLPLTQPIPGALIYKIVKLRIRENKERAEVKARKKQPRRRTIAGRS